MNHTKPSADLTNATNLIRSVLKSQYHSALAMLRETIEKCPEEIWASTEHLNSFWQNAYHALFFAHLYSQPNEAAFRPWVHHQANVQVPDGIPGPPDPNSSLPLIPEPYTRAQLLEYCSFCDDMIDQAIDSMDILSSDSGFSWYRVPKLEHQLVNIRHIQHHMAQLADRLRAGADIGIHWVGARRGKISNSEG
jgi:hypothetical protein